MVVAVSPSILEKKDSFEGDKSSVQLKSKPRSSFQYLKLSIFISLKATGRIVVVVMLTRNQNECNHDDVVVAAVF